MTPAGQSGATQVAAALSELKFDAVYSSPLRRAHDTAQLILAGLKTPPAQPLQLDDRLKEINLALWEGVLFTELAAKDPVAYECWRKTPHLLKMEVPQADGSTTPFYPVPALYEQAAAFWQAVLPHHPGQTLLIVAHSGINRALISTALRVECDRYAALHQSNCGISILNFNGGWDDPVQLESLNLTAHLGEGLPEIRKSHSRARLLLVRHGETDWNREKRFQGQIDVPLNDNGRVQSRQAAEFLKAVPIHHAVTSPMLRPKETAEIILQFHPGVILSPNADLCEISHGLWEGKFEAEIEQEFPGMLQQWQRSPETVQMPEGENLQDVWQRATAAWEAIVMTAINQPEPGTTLVVAHDAVNKAILCAVLGLDPSHFWNFKQGNGAVSVIDYSGDPTDKPLLHAMNITTHLAGGVLDRTAAGAL